MYTHRITKEGRNTYHWHALFGIRPVAGGYARTRADATNDARAWIEKEERTTREQFNTAHLLPQIPN